MSLRVPPIAKKRWVEFQHSNYLHDKNKENNPHYVDTVGNRKSWLKMYEHDKHSKKNHLIGNGLESEVGRVKLDKKITGGLPTLKLEERFKILSSKYPNLNENEYKELIVLALDKGLDATTLYPEIQKDKIEGSGLNLFKHEKKKIKNGHIKSGVDTDLHMPPFDAYNYKKYKKNGSGLITDSDMNTQIPSNPMQSLIPPNSIPDLYTVPKKRKGAAKQKGLPITKKKKVTLNKLIFKGGSARPGFHL